MVTTEKRRGRPPLPPKQRRSKNVTIGFRGDLYDNLVREAASGSRSLSEECARRLDQTFTNQRSLIEALELAYGQRLAGLLLVLGDVVRDVAQTRKADREGWTEKPHDYQQAVDAISAVLDAFRPAGAVSADGVGTAKVIASFGLMMLQSSIETAGFAAEKRRLLGPMLDRSTIENPSYLSPYSPPDHSKAQPREHHPRRFE